jgi:hypothetical protein
MGSASIVVSSLLQLVKELPYPLTSRHKQSALSIKEHCQILFIFSLSLSLRSLRLCGDLYEIQI